MIEREQLDEFVNDLIEPLYTVDATYSTCSHSDACPIFFDTDDSK